MAEDSRWNRKTFPMKPHAAIICGMHDSGKTVFILDLLEGTYRGVFRQVIFLCPSILDNKTYLSRAWIDPGERLHEWLQALFDIL